ncbi:MAG: hypothetical protein R3B68_12705 [Phycisphaerales bacterium]
MTLLIAARGRFRPAGMGCGGGAGLIGRRLRRRHRMQSCATRLEACAAGQCCATTGAEAEECGGGAAGFDGVVGGVEEGFEAGEGLIEAAVGVEGLEGRDPGGDVGGEGPGEEVAEGCVGGVGEGVEVEVGGDEGVEAGSVVGLEGGEGHGRVTK